MEHDSRCERFTVARTVSSKVSLTPEEWNRLTRLEPEFEMGCGCRARVDGKFVDTLDLRSKWLVQCAELILTVRKINLDKQAKELPKRKPNKVSEMFKLSGQYPGKEFENVIAVDFRNRRRL